MYLATLPPHPLLADVRTWQPYLALHPSWLVGTCPAGELKLIPPSMGQLVDGDNACHAAILSPYLQPGLLVVPHTLGKTMAQWDQRQNSSPARLLGRTAGVESQLEGGGEDFRKPTDPVRRFWHIQGL